MNCVDNSHDHRGHGPYRVTTRSPPARSNSMSPYSVRLHIRAKDGPEISTEARNLAGGGAEWAETLVLPMREPLPAALGQYTGYVTFRDAAGRWWRRSDLGDLQETV